MTRVRDKHALPLMIQRFAALGYDAGQADLSDIPVPSLKLDSAAVARVAEKFGVTNATRLRRVRFWVYVRVQNLVLPNSGLKHTMRPWPRPTW